MLAQQEELLAECLSRIRLYTEGPYELIVINDGASNKIAQRLLTNDIKVITNLEFVGVAKGYNQGAAVAIGERLVFLRDHMAVSEGWLNSLSSCLDRHEDAAMVGPVSNDISGMQKTPFHCVNMEQLDNASKALAVTKAGQSQKVTRLLSHLLIMNSDIFQRLGGFDERFELETYEDDDICYRVLQAGYSMYMAEDCFVRYIAPPPLMPNDPDWYGRQLERNKAAAWNKWGFDITEALLRWKRQVTVSLCMIVKNEEQTLDRCLASVRDFVDEIVIVDTGSTDKTKEIASRYTDRIVDFEWVNDFAKARNYAFSLATREYVLWLDADDIVLPADAEKFKTIVSNLEWNTDSVSMHYNLAFDDAGNVTTSLRRNRLVKRERGFRWIGMVHEYLEVSGHVVYSDICITHDRIHTNSTRNLNIYEERLDAGEVFSTRDMLYFANELSDNGQWERAFATYEQFLQRSDGWIEDKINACGRAADSLMELGRLEEAKTKALQAFAYSLPRAEHCCKLGLYHMKEERYEEATYWYKQALSAPKPVEPNAMLVHACWTWLPHLQLCVCYDRLGQPELASIHNDSAGIFVPNDSSVLANKQYFDKVF